MSTAAESPPAEQAPAEQAPTQKSSAQKAPAQKSPAQKTSAQKSPAELWAEIRDHDVAPGTVAFWWLYQAGFVLKAPDGTLVAIDPYLSDAVLRSYHQPRNVPSPLDPAEAQLDAVLASHSHEDHLDPDSISEFARCEKTRFIGPPMAAFKVGLAGVDKARTVVLRRGEQVLVGAFTIRAVHARHPFYVEPVPDAIGYVLEAGPVSLYHGGDTEYDAEIVGDSRGVTVSLIPINGTAGNMNAEEAALLAWRQRPRLAVPMHYGLWRDEGYGPGATLDPGLFVDTLHKLWPEARTLLLEPGRAVTVDSTGLRS